MTQLTIRFILWIQPCTSSPYYPQSNGLSIVPTTLEVIEECQKFTHIANQSEYDWLVAEAYHRADELIFTAEEISSKHMEEAVKHI